MCMPCYNEKEMERERDLLLIVRSVGLERGGEPLAGEIIKLNERRRSQYAVQVTLMPLAGERLETLFLRQENFTK